MEAVLQAPVQEEVIPEVAPRPTVPVHLRMNLDSEVVRQLRDMLRLNPDELLPDDVWIAIGMRCAVDEIFASGEITHGNLVELVLYSQMARSLRERSVVKEGAVVTIKSQNAEAYYVCRGPFGRELVNRHGRWFLVGMDDLKISPMDRSDSEVNKPLSPTEKDIRAALTLAKPKQ